MSIKCNRCGTLFDSPFCPNCGAPAQQQFINRPIQQMQPPMMPQPIVPGYMPIHKKKSMPAGLIVLITLCSIFVFFGLVFTAFVIFSSPNDTTGNTENVMSDKTQEDTIKYIKITSTELINAYKDNSVKCKQLYDKKYLEVTGSVQSVGEDILGNIYVCLGHDTDFTFVGIQCYAKDKDTEAKIAELLEGDVITVRGKGNCGSLAFSLDEAIIIE